jgi:hypothetical protein
MNKQIQKYSKRSDRNLVVLAKLGNTGLKEAYVIEKGSNLPGKFKVPRVIISKKILNARRFK